ncbi:uncharacterized protein LOC112567252 [Pomacea canaliculata]|nr:uncharacterized protein LOC112567252 [Pomacea canaliculata]
MPVTYRLRQEALELRRIVRTINTELDEHHKNVNIANATGSAASLFGGVLTIAGAILAIPTAGLTLPLAGAGALVAGAGGAVCLGASIVELVIQKHNLNDVDRRWETFQKDLSDYYTDVYGSEVVPSNILNIVGKIIDGAIEVRQGYQLIKGGVAAIQAIKAGQAGGKLAMGVSKVASMFEAGALGSVASLGTKTLGKAFFVMNVVLIPFSLVDLVRSAAAANSGERSAASSKLDRLADFLEKVANDEL